MSFFLKLKKFHVSRVTGVRPFKGVDAHETLLLNKRCKINYGLLSINKLTSFGVDLLKKMLNPKAEERPSSKKALEHPFFELTTLEHDKNFDENKMFCVFSIKNSKEEEK